MAGSAVIGALRVNLGIDSAEFQEGLRNAAKSLKGLGQQMTKIGAGLSAAVTAPLTAFGVSIVKTAGDFEASMNRVDAATGATAEEFKALEKLALDLGANTSKSASESADMLEMLAKNGLDATQILDGAAVAAIKLSEATGGDLSRSADVATNVMAQFGKEAKDLAPIVDQITAVTLASQFGFDDYALALGQAGGVAGAVGVDLTDFNAVLAATSSVFNSGSDAGTSFKTFLTRLVPASDTAAAAMESLNLKFFNADGSMKSMSGVAEELRTKMSGLSDEALNENMTDIFGVDGMRTAIMLMKEGGAGIDAMIQKVNQKGVAEEQAAARMKGFNGEMEKLSGAFENLQIAIASSGLLEMVTGFVTQISGWIDALAATNPELLKWGTIIAGLAAALGPVVLAVGMLATGIAAISAPVALVVGGIAALTAGIIAFWPEIDAAGKAVNQFLFSIGPNLLAALNTAKQKFLDLGTYLEGLSNQIVGFFAALPGQMLQIGGQIIDGLWNGIKSKWESVKAGVAGIANSITTSIKSTLGIHSPSKVMHEVGVNTMQGLANGMASMNDEVKGIAADTANAIATIKPQLGDAWAGLREVTSEAKAAHNDLSSMFSGLGSSIAGLIKGTKSWRDVLADVLGQLAQAAISSIGAGGSGGGLGGFLSGLLGGLVGFARGGTILPGGAGGIDSQLVMFRKSPNERVDITKPGQTLSGSREITLHVIGEEGPMFRPTIQAESEGVAMKVTQGGFDQYDKSQRRGGVAVNQGSYQMLKRR